MTNCSLALTMTSDEIDDEKPVVQLLDAVDPEREVDANSPTAALQWNEFLSSVVSHKVKKVRSHSAHSNRLQFRLTMFSVAVYIVG
jgi:hypothetical protein